MQSKLPHTDAEAFLDRHLGPRPRDVDAMVERIGYDTLDSLVDAVIPPSIRLDRALDIPPAMSERDVLETLHHMAERNQVFRSYIGMGYADCVTPPVIQRNILENPGWYTAYTPYQAEISQGRLEALLNFQTMVSDLTGFEIANASLLDEATAAAEAMTMSLAAAKRAERPTFLVDANCHPQTIAVVQTRAEARGIAVVVAQPGEFEYKDGVFGVLLQYPGSDGRVTDCRGVINEAHATGALVTVATDLLALVLLTSPGELGADIAVGNSQRFGVPLGYGGPHAAFFATRETHRRLIPGRVIGVSKDSAGNPALRMALQTREQHIRRDKATSNICTAQVLLAVIAGMYAAYHGPDGLTRIAKRVHALSVALAEGLKRLGHTITHDAFFDTIQIETDPNSRRRALDRARQNQINLRETSHSALGISLDETTTLEDVHDLLALFADDSAPSIDVKAIAQETRDASAVPQVLQRTTSFLTHPVFHRYRSETEMLRYMKRLEIRDLSLTSAMIPLGSCTMKLNATVEMIPITWKGFADLHPFAPREQAKGYNMLFEQFERWLAEITGLPHVSLQPNAGSQGEFTGLLVIRAYHRARGDERRDVCLIPMSAHGTNPASAVMAGMKVVAINTDAQGNIDLDDLRAKARANADVLAGLMITYPSTHGVFEEAIREICDVIHTHGGQVFLDGANMNAQVGLCRPGDFGADVCHLNLHKTFCIPHGGGGPGMGPICTAEHLAPYLPDHPVVTLGVEQSCGAVAAAPWGSPSILPISWAYIALLGPNGLTEASKIAILNANYIAHRLKDEYSLLYSGKDGLIAHECIIDVRQFKASTGVEVEDIAKRLIDYGFHAPTVSWPVLGTMMVEPTESESKEELDRFCNALSAIREEIREIEEGRADRTNNLLTNAPHTMRVLMSDSWDRPYSRERAAFPTPDTREPKSWPHVGRIDGAYGDRNLMCTCPPIEEYSDAPEPIGAE